jgi:hypothetical protein
MPFTASIVQRPPAYLTGDRVIQPSYRRSFTNSSDADTLGKSNGQLVAQICHTGHFFRFAFATRFLGDRNGRIL